ncbi:hypothetical protein HPB52_014659 [Rhipicephalus sanguineus]|uniref:EGF-like domain-containing protein n=1 Tax=Rhipicephalus sanguineus TaxID=34632 RepID=A0A9D4T0Y3_RHISA|nr:hypothetical protein HPB52_014659 [Rhipicephalus sanguineus]
MAPGKLLGRLLIVVIVSLFDAIDDVDADDGIQWLGDACHDDDDCHDAFNLLCVRGQCICKQGFVSAQFSCHPVPPFHPIYPRAWFMRLDAILAVNGIKAQPMMHAVLLNALPVELCHLAAKSSSSPRPYDDLCAAVLACYGQTYRPLPGSRELQISPPSQGAGPIGPEPSLDQDFTSPATNPPTSRPATSASIPAPDHPPDEVQEVPAAIGHSTERSVFSTASAHGPSDSICTSSPTSTVHDTSDKSGSTTATSPHALEPGIDTDIVTPAVRPPIAEASPVMSNKPAFSTSTLCASCQQELPSSSKSPAADVQAHNQLRPNVRDAATMTENPEDHPPCLPQVDQTAYALPATQAYNPPAAPHTRSPLPTKQLHSATTAAPSSSPSNAAHHTEITSPLGGECTYHAQCQYSDSHSACDLTGHCACVDGFRPRRDTLTTKKCAAEEADDDDRQNQQQPSPPRKHSRKYNYLTVGYLKDNETQALLAPGKRPPSYSEATRVPQITISDYSSLSHPTTMAYTST